MNTLLQLQSIQTEQFVHNFRPVNNEAINELLLRSNMNWEVQTEPLFLQGSDKQIPFLGVVRQSDKHVFQTVSKQYEPIQNREVAELAMLIADATSSEIEVAKTLDNGAIQYFTIEGRKFNLEANKVGDVISEKITIVNSHNGAKALGISFGHVVLSCTNGMTRFDRKGYISIRHTGSMKSKLKDAIKGLRRVTDESKRMIESYHRLTEKQVTPDHIKKVMEIVTKVEMDTPAEKLSSRASNIINAAYSSLTSEMSYKGQTAWGLLNGATHYTTKLAGESDAKLKSKMFGRNARADKSVWDYLQSI